MTRRRWLFVAVLIGTLVAALLPPAEAPSLGWTDKVNHIAAFLTLTLLAAWAWPTARLWRIGILMSGFGAVIEGLQAIPFIARDAEWADWFADSAAVVFALLVVIVMRRLKSTGSGA